MAIYTIQLVRLTPSDDDLPTIPECVPQVPGNDSLSLSVDPVSGNHSEFRIQWIHQRIISSIDSEGNHQPVSVNVPKTILARVNTKYRLLTHTGSGHFTQNVLKSLWTSSERPLAECCNIDIEKILWKNDLKNLIRAEFPLVVVNRINIENITNVTLTAENVEAKDLRSLMDGTKAKITCIVLSPRSQQNVRVQLSSSGTVRLLVARHELAAQDTLSYLEEFLQTAGIIR